MLIKKTYTETEIQTVFMVLQDSKFVPLIQVTLELSVKKKPPKPSERTNETNQKPARLFIQAN